VDRYIDFTEALKENAVSDVQMFIHARDLHVNLHDFDQKDRVVDLLERAVSELRRSFMAPVG